MSSRPRRARTLLALAVALVTAGCARGPEAPPTSMDQDVPLEGWIRVESPGIEIVSAADESRTLALARELQIFRALARSLTGVRTEPRLPTRAFLFPDARAFHYFAADGIEGQFRQYPSGCLLLLSADDPEARHVLFHEYVHFLLHNQAVGYPKWYDEGLAELLGGVRIREHLVTVGAMVGREGTLANPDALLPLETVIGARSYADAGTRVSGFYAQSWLLTHLLTLGHHAGYPKRLDALRRYLAALQTAPDWRTAFDTYFPEGLEALSRDLESYRQRAVSGSHLPRIGVDARKLEGAESALAVRPIPPPGMALVLGQVYLDLGPEASRYAERLFERALEFDPGHAPARLGLARARAQRGAFEDAAAELERAAALAPEQGALLLAQGDVLLLQAQSLDETNAALARELRARSRDALRRAVSLDPDAIEAQVLLGRTYLTDEASVAEGLAALERAHSVLPSHEGISLDLARLYARAGQPERALEHLDRVVRWAQGEQLEQAIALRTEVESAAASAPPLAGGR